MSEDSNCDPDFADSQTSASEVRQRSELTEDQAMQEFLDLVNCDPQDVRDTPKERLLTTEELKAECANIDPELRSKSLSKMPVYFGMHKGKRLEEVPLSYLEWVLRETPTNKSFRKFKKQVGEFLRV